MIYEHDGLAITLANKFKGRCHSEQDYEDLLQVTRMIILDLEKSHDPEKSKFTTYCYTGVYRKLLNHFETAALRDYLKIDFIEYEDREEDYRNCKADNLILLRQLVRGLSKRDQKIYSMKMAGYYNKEIGKKLKISAERVRQLFNDIKDRVTKIGTSELCLQSDSKEAIK